jgi:hypothetical protein
MNEPLQTDSQKKSDFFHAAKASTWFATLTGGRLIFALNLLALAVAFVIFAETNFVDEKIVGRTAPTRLWWLFIPVAAMMMIRVKIFSIAFLMLQILLAIFLLSFHVWPIIAGTPPKFVDAWSVSGAQLTVVLLSIFCAVIYLVFVLLRVIVQWASKTASK